MITIFHDIDLLPNEEAKGYYTRTVPRGTVMHIAGLWKRYSGDSYFGGIQSFGAPDFKAVNGYPNNYWGWGGEDDELRRRVQRIGLQIDRPLSGRIFDLEELSLDDKLSYLKQKDIKNKEKRELAKQHSSTWKTNGLSNLSYTVISRRENNLLVKILVELNKHVQY